MTEAELLAMIIERLEIRARRLEGELEMLKSRRLETVRRQAGQHGASSAVARFDIRIRDIWVKSAARLTDPATDLSTRYKVERSILGLSLKREQMRVIQLNKLLADPAANSSVPAELRLRLWQLRGLVSERRGWEQRDRVWRHRLVRVVTQRRGELKSLAAASNRLASAAASLYELLAAIAAASTQSPLAHRDRIILQERALRMATDLQMQELWLVRRRRRLDEDWPELHDLPRPELVEIEQSSRALQGGTIDWDRLREALALGFAVGLPEGERALSSGDVRDHLGSVRSLATGAKFLARALIEPPLPVAPDQDEALLSLERDLARFSA